MAVIECQYQSEVLGMGTTMNVILPQKAKSAIGVETSSSDGPPKALYLLHGLSDDHSAWLRRTNIDRYANRLGIAVIMPTTHRGFYTNAVDGYRYYDHIAHEVPKISERMFNISNKREDKYIAGLSMGGYGAFKIGLSQPEHFCAAASLSGVTDIQDRFFLQSQPPERTEFTRIFGPLDRLADSPNDLHFLARELLNDPQKKQLKPRLFQCCGTEDFLYDGNQNTKQLLSSLDYDYHYEESPGIHDWNYWDTNIRRVLQWMFERKTFKAFND